MYDFPNAPVNGTQATGSGGQVYTFDGTKWKATATAAGVTSWNTRTGAVTMSSGDVTTALTFTPYNATNPSGYQTAAQVTTALAPYAPLNAPVFTGDARAVTASYGDNDTSISTTAFVQSAVAPAFNGVGRNLVTNGTFAVAQRGAGSWTTSGYTVDRWYGQTNTDTISFSVTSLVDADRTAIGNEAAQSGLQNTFTGNAAAAAYNRAFQGIEGVRRLSGKTVSVSFWAKAASGTPKLGVSIDQSFGTGGSPSAYLTGNGQSVTISTAWARYSVSVAVPSSAGKTFGTNGDDASYLLIWYSASTTNATPSGNVGVQSGTVQLWGVQLEIGSQPTVLDPGGSPQAILAECQRFFFQAVSIINYGYGGASGNVGQYLFFPVAMRATPTIALSGQSYVNASGLTAGNITSAGCLLNAVATATGNYYWVGNMTASADL